MYTEDDYVHSTQRDDVQRYDVYRGMMYTEYDDYVHRDVHREYEMMYTEGLCTQRHDVHRGIMYTER